MFRDTKMTGEAPDALAALRANPEPQALFNFVVTALLRQGKPALSVHGHPTMVANNGCRCAKGHLLSDADLDNLRFGFVHRVEHRELIDDLEVGHDLVWARQGFGAFRRYLRLIAAKHGLSAAVLGEGAR